MTIIWDKLCPDTRKHLLSYLHFFDLKNIEPVSKQCISPLQLKQALRTFIDTHNLIGYIYSIQKPIKISNYFLQIYYLKSKYVWDYMYICSNKDVYKYKMNERNRLIPFISRYTQDSLVIYNAYRNTCSIQLTQRIT